MRFCPFVIRILLFCETDLMFSLPRTGCVSCAVLLGAWACLPAAAAAAPQTRSETRTTDLDAVAIRILLGVDDKEPVRWDGRASLTAGDIVRTDPWRFRPEDRVIGVSEWRSSSYMLAQPARGNPRMAPTGVVLMLRPRPGARLDVQTAQGEFHVPLDDAKPGERLPFLEGRVIVDRVAAAQRIVSSDGEDDFPAAATAADGTIWIAYVHHTPRGPADLQPFAEPPRDFHSLVPLGGGDQVLVAHFDGKAWSDPVALTPPDLDVWRPAVAADGQGRVHVVWSQSDEKGNWDLFQRIYDPSVRAGTGKQESPGLSALRRLTGGAGADVFPSLATDSAGRVWLAWQGWRDGQADIWLTALVDADAPLAEPVRLTDSASNAWAPAVAADAHGRVHVAYDSYAAGNYDVYLRTQADGKLSDPIPIATSARFEARPSITCDAEDRVWITYEQRAADWGKDFGPLSPVQGSPLYMRGSSIQVRVLAGARLLEPAAELLGRFPEELQRHNSFPRLAVDGSGRVWVAFRHRLEAIWGNNPVHMLVGAVWLEYATCLDGDAWSAPVFLAASDNVLDVRPALARVRGERLLAIYPADGRLRHEVIGADEQRKIFFTGGGVTVSGQAKNELYAAVLPRLPAPRAAELKPVDASAAGPPGPAPNVPVQRGANPLDPDPEPKPLHGHGAADLERIRGYRIESGGKSYRLLRGEFHRHTELSMDGGEDGSLEDMWRYARDAAELDWIGNGDHDAGGGREYPWWIIQKTTDIFHAPPRFVPMFTYERSVPYPNGHRNVMFDRRGIRTLPRLMGDDPGGVSPDDTKMLYAYLKQLGGVCASHTSGTGMGTDWRDNEPAVEPIVEIYQGDRNSYEHLGGPRVARRAGDALGGWRPLGMVWNALAMGHRLGFQSSSDHWSTHISYAVVLAEEPSRGAILDAFRKRHCYGATDNIVLDVRLGEHVMGDELVYRAGGRTQPTFRVRVHGTGPLERVDIIKDFVYAYTTAPEDSSTELDWTDPDPRPGASWYYVRVLQKDGQLAWGSPIWVQYPAKK